LELFKAISHLALNKDFGRLDLHVFVLLRAFYFEVINCSKTSPEQIDNSAEIDNGAIKSKSFGLNQCEVNSCGNKGEDLFIFS